MKASWVALLTALAVASCGGEHEQNSEEQMSGSQLLAQTTVSKQPTGADGKPESQTSTRTVAGTDSNKNGVRDDVDRYIATRFKDQAKAKAMAQLAAAIQKALVQNDTTQKAQKAARGWFRALACVEQTLGEAGYYESKRLTAEMLNTELRSRAYALHEANSGGFYDMPKGDVCDK